MGITQFTAYTDAEFALTYLSPKVYDPEWENVEVAMPDLAETIDWTAKGAVSPVKNQGTMWIMLGLQRCCHFGIILFDG